MAANRPAGDRVAFHPLTICRKSTVVNNSRMSVGSAIAFAESEPEEMCRRSRAVSRTTV